MPPPLPLLCLRSDRSPVWQFLASCCIAVSGVLAQPATSADPIAPPDLIFGDRRGIIAVEAEHFIAQELAETRGFRIVSTIMEPAVTPDPDGSHAATASGRAYVEVLPDTLAVEIDQPIEGINFTETPGQHAVLSYRVRFPSPGRYYFWARTYSTGDYDNSVHVGLNGNWPESGRRWVSIKKNSWHWDCAQQTNEVRVGASMQSYIEVPVAGVHVVQLSMRRDGFEIDKWVLARGVAFVPTDDGPSSVVLQGTPPPPFPPPRSAEQAQVSNGGGASLPYPTHWGTPPLVQTRDLRPLPAGFGQGSSTEARWIEEKISQDQAREAAGTRLEATSLDLTQSGAWIDRERWATIDLDTGPQFSLHADAPVPPGRYHITLKAVGENLGSSTYELLVGGRLIGRYLAPPSSERFQEGPAFNHVWEHVEIKDGEIIEVRGLADTNDDGEQTGARWSALVFTPEDFDPLRPPSAPFPGASQARYQRSGAMVSGPGVLARLPDGTGDISVHGDLFAWHKVTLDLDGPFAHEDDVAPNPFTDYAFNVTFTHASGSPSYEVPGYFAADGNAAETGANSGSVWRAHLSPDAPGEWTYQITFRGGAHAATYAGGVPVAPYHGLNGSFTVGQAEVALPDFRARGRLRYTGERYLRFAGDGTAFLKAGPDAPETFLAYTGFDNTHAGRENVPLKAWTPHTRDWRTGDPTWRDGRGKGIIGALNYLADKGVNAFSFLTYNAGGDGDNVWPFVDRDDKLHYDVSKLAQWEVVFAHAQSRGLYLHFKLQENEIDDHRAGHRRDARHIPEAMDGGETGPERRLYFREMIARYGHHLALNWNFGEENTQSYEEQIAMFNYVAAVDPYDHHRVIHTFPQDQDAVYGALLGDRSNLTGISAQNSWRDTHARTLQWVQASAASGRRWVVANDEQGPAGLGVPPDPGYAGFDGVATMDDGTTYTLHDIRRQTLWGNLMAGGAGVEYYFGYGLPQNDLIAEDYRSRDQSWDYARIALDYFNALPIDIATLQPADHLVANDEPDATANWCLAATGKFYVIYLPAGGEARLDLREAAGHAFRLTWFNPRDGARIESQPEDVVEGGAWAVLPPPPTAAGEDWVIQLQRSHNDDFLSPNSQE